MVRDSSIATKKNKTFSSHHGHFHNTVYSMTIFCFLVTLESHFGNKRRKWDGFVNRNFLEKL
jgi:hypothetical protein